MLSLSGINQVAENIIWKKIAQKHNHFVNMTGSVLPNWCCNKESIWQCKTHKRRRFAPWVGRSPGVVNGNPLQYSCLENPVERGAWWATVHGVTKSNTTERLNMHTCSHNSVPRARNFLHTMFIHQLVLSFFLPLVFCDFKRSWFVKKPDYPAKKKDLSPKEMD